MRSLKKIIIFTILAVLIILYYVHLTSRSANDIEGNSDTTVVGELLAIDMDLNYPTTPRDVVIYYSKVIKAFYGEKLTDNQLIGLAQHARATFDAELLEYNDYEEYMERLEIEIEAYHQAKKVITDFIIQRASDVEYFTDNGVQYAKVEALYYLSEGSSTRTKTYECYTLRKGENGKWKILYWETIPEKDIKGE